MLVRDFMDLCLEAHFQFVEFYDINSGETLLQCYYDEIPKCDSYLKNCEIASWNCIAGCGICFNVEVN